MKKISILEQFASDAISAPAVVTGGCAPACQVTKVKTVKCKAKSSSKKIKSVKPKTSKTGACGCPPPPPVCW